MNKLILITTVLFVGLAALSPVRALEQGEIRINSIEVPNFFAQGLESQDYIPLIDKPNYLFEYVQPDNAFYVRVSNPPFRATLREAQNAIMDKLEVTKNEACYLGIYATGPAYLVPGDTMYTPLPFCEGPARVDFNGDNVVNGIDLTEGLDAAAAGTVEPDQVADLNVNGRVDATDLSLILQHFGSPVPTDEAPLQPHSSEYIEVPE
jgi:hypothetical protein